jgi:hypothetical protein
MSLLSLFNRPKDREASTPASVPAGRSDTSLPPGRRPDPETPGEAAQRRGERSSRREQLYAVVRESMIRAGVLTSAYRFKVLSLDGAGRQFLVMIDLTGVELPVARQAEIEAALAQAAQARHGLQVQSVYWRHAATQGAAQAQPPQVPQTPAALMEARRAARAAAAAAAAGKAGAERPPERHTIDPIEEEEVVALRQALAEGMATPAPAAADIAAPTRPAAAAPAPTGAKGKARGKDADPGANNYALLTGFEDTEMSSSRLPGSLSTTQYGDLN